MFFDGWGGVVRVVVVGLLAYLALVTILRLAGSRSLAKMSAYDLVVTVALGSTLATILLTEDVVLAEGIVALLLLISLQYAVTWSSVRLPPVRDVVKGGPTVLLYRGRFLPESMRRARVVEAEVLAALRGSGLARCDQAEAVVLETDGSFSVVPRTEGPADTLRDVAGVAETELGQAA